MIMVKYFQPQLILPLGEGVIPFVNAQGLPGGATLGIRIINADKLSNSIFNVTQNTINFNFDESNLGENLYRGIFMSNSSGVKIANNTIKWNSGLTDPARINSHAEQVMGMRLEKVQTSDIKDNTVTTCGTGMFMQGACNGTYITCNQLDNNYPGIGFDAVVLPQQGDLCQPANNRWLGTYTDANGKVEEYTPGTSFYYYYSGAANDPANFRRRRGGRPRQRYRARAKPAPAPRRTIARWPASRWRRPPAGFRGRRRRDNACRRR